MRNCSEPVRMFVLRNRLNKFTSALLNWSRSLDPSSAFGAVHFTVMMRINSSFKQCINTYVTSSGPTLYQISRWPTGYSKRDTVIGNTEIIEMETGCRLWVSQKVTPNISFLSRFDLVLKLLINSKNYITIWPSRAFPFLFNIPKILQFILDHLFWATNLAWHLEWPVWDSNFEDDNFFILTFSVWLDHRQFHFKFFWHLSKAYQPRNIMP